MGNFGEGKGSSVNGIGKMVYGLLDDKYNEINGVLVPR